MTKFHHVSKQFLFKVRSNNWESETGDSSSTCSRKTKVILQNIGVDIVNDTSLFQGHKTVYSSKSGSKSFDELDDLLCEKPRKSNSKRRGRRTQSSVSGADVLKAAERRQAAERRRGGAAPECRHSCDEVNHIILVFDIDLLVSIRQCFPCFSLVSETTYSYFVQDHLIATI